MAPTRKIVTLLTALVFSFQVIQAQQVSKSTNFDTIRLLQDIEILSADDMQGRAIGTPGSAKARDYISRRFKDAGLSSFGGSFFKQFNYNAVTRGTNVVGYIKGTQNVNRYIVVTAHYDHLGVINGQIFNGADDNASGTAALIAMAGYFKKNRPLNSILFVAFDAEEEGLRGSRAFVASPPVTLDAISINVNMDMISHNDKSELYAAGTYHYPALKAPLLEVAQTAKIKLIPGHDDPKLGKDDWTTQSDHFPFHDKHIPFIYFGVEDHDDYHKPTDDFTKINQDFYIQAVEVVLDTIKKLDANVPKIARTQ